MMRLFVAVDLSIQVVERLARFQTELREVLKERWANEVRLRCVKAPNVHLTLKFLGDVTPEMIPVIEETLAKLCKPLFPFEVECRGVGAFPDVSQPRILWAGLDETSAEVLGLLQKALERDLGRIGVEKETRPFAPHVTLARVKTLQARSMEEILKPFEQVSFGKSFIKDLVLFASHLDPEGPRYEVLRRFSLGES
jgi:RNA 2',3'-cyclic 3'-phosphodiesterase